MTPAEVSFRPLGFGTECLACGAVVTLSAQDVHVAWHDAMDAALAAVRQDGGQSRGAE